MTILRSMMLLVVCVAQHTAAFQPPPLFWAAPSRRHAEPTSATTTDGAAMPVLMRITLAITDDSLAQEHQVSANRAKRVKRAAPVDECYSAHVHLALSCGRGQDHIIAWLRRFPFAAALPVQPLSYVHSPQGVDLTCGCGDGWQG